ncbi:MAG: rod shape-determining protein MreC [Stygiobacter sp. RIFOXYC12_FULL_38_8]|nr:MAG: rod shape-determining protein MreC [Stygiobacter sp. RIFOXYB2_FULL_37_11]OGV11251.1 MAG: rod shape-determining protein MreC [Stygiobacter sp. RIFOXYA2_FULL_38_8]OGV12120.1 MAG: rod shape-determining protein MreC [Stygiobacter sp. RIFOXYC2_FULL_38_25]OGV26503.1 MAG: rod shape-determining protein MreC [Stygiobacter sp. RIFOXYC12_FULL_38_8]OGV81246.1 MAG: rod shape-determining protein MreC [Stygiobacter sp. GWF2_38_21]OGV98871.1 MAG: rod shape-determining protein MreC [Melioribacter sp. R
MIKIFQRLGYQFKEYVLLVILVIVSLISISLSEKPQAKKLKALAIANFAVLSEITESVASIFSGDVSVEELKLENAKISLQLSKLKKVAAENEELRAMINMRDTSSSPLIPVRIVSKLITKIQGNFIVNRGSGSGLVKGMPVINHQGLVGLIMDVAEEYSVVRTLQNSSLNIAVTLQRSNVDGILSFDGRDLVIKNIPTTYDVKIGDRIETSDFSSLFPPSVPVGVVLKKETNELGLLHSLTVKPFADIEATNNLFVIGIVPSKQVNHLEMNLLKKP